MFTSDAWLTFQSCSRCFYKLCQVKRVNRYFKPVLCLTAALLLAAAFLRDGYGFTDIPAPSLKEQLMVPEKSVSTYIPSHAAPGSGLAVNIIYPGKARY